MPLTWPLAGRETELESIRTALAQPPAFGLVLVGPAGAGKTRLAQEVMTLAEGAGRPTLWASATSAASTIPFGALAHLLPNSLPRGAGPQNLLRTVGEVLTGDGVVRPVLCIDDAHLLDEASAALIHHVTTSGRASVVVVVRSGERVLDPIVSLWKDGHAQRLDIRALSREHSDAVVRSVLAGQVDPGALQLLWNMALGNPLFLRELILGGRETGALRQDEGLWRWHGSAGPLPRLVEIVESRLGALQQEDSRALEVVALSEPVEASFVESMVGLSILERLERRGLLRSELRGLRVCLRLSHPLYAEVLRTRVPHAQVRDAHRRLADALEESGARRRGDLLRLAAWRLEGGGRASPQLFVAAAHQAMAAFDFELAERLAGAAVAAGGGADASQALAGALVGRGRFDEAEVVLAGFDAPSPGDAAARFRPALARADNLFWRLGRGDEAQRLVQKSRAEAADQAARDELAAAEALHLLFKGQADEAIVKATGLLKRQDAEDSAVVSAAMTSSFALAMVGRSEESLAVVARTQHLAEHLAVEMPFAQHWLRGASCWAHAAAGRFDAAAEEMQRGYREAVAQGVDLVRGPYAFGASVSMRMQGTVKTASVWGRQALVMFREVDLFRHLSSCLAELAHCAALSGDVQSADALLAEAEAERVESFKMDTGFIGLARVWGAAARGERSQAVSLALETAEETAAMGQVFLGVMALHDVARLGEPRHVIEPLREVAGRFTGSFARTCALHAAALIERNAGLLETVSDAFAGMGTLILAAEAAAEAARVHRDAGRKGSQSRLAARAGALAGRCEGAVTPGLSRIEAIILTTREREIAGLAARGLSNREIAGRLFVSYRTVENHLYRIYAKLGIEDRGDLAAIVAP